jgi:hypothetical protein
VTFDACSLEVSRALKKVVHKLKHWKKVVP